MRVNRPIDIKPGELRCPRCFLRDIVPSLQRGWQDAVMRWFGRIPKHCRSCEKRFYVRRSEAGEPGPGEDTTPARED